MLKLIRQFFIVLLSFRRSLSSIFNASEHTKCISLINQIKNAQFNLFLLNYILMNKFKDYVTILLQSIKKDALEVVILLLIYRIENVFQIK